ncbi:Otopetrin [Popillia japonica]|uniref:Otopetrin n=1 Tax=Popillia japonica TaxID=7064 RepID=A0AAW1JYN3_POPJA
MAEASGNAAKIEEVPGDDTTVKFKIGDQSDISEPFDNQEITFTEQPIGKNYGRTFSQDTEANKINGLPKQRHISATVQPTMYGQPNKIKKSPSVNSMSSMTKPRLQQGKNGMVLQVMLPSGINTSMPNGINGMHNGGISHEPSFNTFNTADGLKRRRPDSVQDQMSPQNSLFFNYGDLGTMKGPGTIMSEAMSHAPTPTPHEEKKRFTQSSVSIQYSLLYAIFLICFGVTIYIVEVITEEYGVLKTVFSYYIVCISLLFILYMLIDVMLYMKKRKKYIETLENNKTDDVEFLEHPEGGLHLSIPLPAASSLQKPLPHHYCLATGRHGGISMYLKIGAAIFALVFALGHIIHSGLILGYQLVYLTADWKTFYECTTIPLLVLDFIYPFYAFLLLFFIFKYSNIIINRHIILARFGFMHCLGSGLCFWVHTILRETFDALAFYNPEKDYGKEASLNKTIGALGYDKPERSVRMWTGICDGEAGMAIIYQNFSPILYPFSVEFNILMVGIIYMLWSNIANCKQSFEHNDKAAENARDCESDFEEAPEKESNITIHVDCHSSSRGIFGGIVIIIVLIVTIILFFVASSDERFEEMGTTINRATMLAVQCIALIAVVWAYTYTAKLDINTHDIPPLDDVLLYVAVPMFYLNLIFSMAAAIYFDNGLFATYLLIMTIQIVVQTTFIVDGLRRSSNCRETRLKKPGRELIVFLIITNAALWVTMTFEVSAYLLDDRYEFYGRVLWSILGHVWLPLMMFYRFHASACLADMWKYCYEKGGH